MLSKCNFLQDIVTGDTAGIKYSGWLEQNNTIGKLFDSNVSKDRVLKITVGEGKEIKGWDEGTLICCFKSSQFLKI